MNKTRMPAPIQHDIGSTRQQLGKRKKLKACKWERKNSNDLFADDMFLYVENFQDSTKLRTDQLTLQNFRIQN